MNNNEIYNEEEVTQETQFVYLLFFLSGFSALIYEVAWLSRIQLVMGHTVYALSTTLSAYLSGIALGALFATRLIKVGLSSYNAFWLYVLAELLIGLYGIVFQPLLSLFEIPYSLIVTDSSFTLSQLSFVQFITCSLVILLPTFLMGTTLPLLAHHLYVKRNEIAIKTPSLYAVNTFGACAGTLMTGFVILPAIGYSGSIYFAAAINLFLILLAVIAFNPLPKISFKGWWSGFVTAVKGKGLSKSKVINKGDWRACLALFVSGLVCMMVQILWNRLAGLSFGSSVYIFPMVTTVVLLGIVLGSLAFRRVSASLYSSNVCFIFIPIISALLFYIGSYLFTKTPVLVFHWHQWWNIGFWSYSTLSFLLLCACLLPSAMAMGALFPVATAVLTRNKSKASEALGVGYALNIFGIIIGALLGSFWILPDFGIEGLGFTVFLVLVSLGVLLAATSKLFKIASPVIMVLGLIIIKIVPGYDWNMLTSGYFYNRTDTVDRKTLLDDGYYNLTGFSKWQLDLLMAHKDDPHATISIHESATDKSSKDFRINGKPDGSTAKEDMQTTRLLGLLPLLVKQDAETVLTIGLGIGSTVAETLRYPNLKQSTVIELSSAIVDFSKKYFSEISGDIWNDSRMNIFNRDGREYLRHTKNKYDVIITEPSNPWVNGVSSLFTKDFFELLNSRLSDDGVALVWFHGYGASCEAVTSILKAVANSFESMVVLSLDSDSFILAQKKQEEVVINPLDLSLMDIENDIFDIIEIKKEPTRKENYKKLIKKMVVADRQSVLRYSRGHIENTDDNSFLQYELGKSYWTDVSCDDLSDVIPENIANKYIGKSKSISSRF